MTRSLLFQMKVPRQYWSDAILTATYLINRLPSIRLENKSPLEILYQRKINIDHLKVFGCVCFIYKKRKDKFDSTSTKGIFLGYSNTKKGYKCYDPINKKLFISRDVIFNENESYFSKEEISEPITNGQNNIVSPNNQTQDLIVLTEVRNEDENRINERGEENNSNGNNNENEEQMGVRRSSRTIQPSTKLRDFVTYKVTYPIQDFISYDKISTNHKAFLNSLSKEEEPRNFQEALSQPVWCNAMKEELSALEKNNTWVIMPLPKDKKPV